MVIISQKFICKVKLNDETNCEYPIQVLNKRRREGAMVELRLAACIIIILSHMYQEKIGKFRK